MILHGKTFRFIWDVEPLRLSRWYHWFDNHNNELRYFVCVVFFSFSASSPRDQPIHLRLKIDMSTGSKEMLRGKGEEAEKCVRQFLCSVKYQFSFLSAIIPFDTHCWSNSSSSSRKRAKLGFILTHVDWDYVSMQAWCVGGWRRRVSRSMHRRLRWRALIT